MGREIRTVQVSDVGSLPIVSFYNKNVRPSGRTVGRVMFICATARVAQIEADKLRLKGHVSDVQVHNAVVKWGEGPTVRWDFFERDVIVTWGALEELLGRAHDGSHDDDATLIAALLESDAPSWVVDAEGYLDEEGWYLRAPGVAADEEGA